MTARRAPLALQMADALSTAAECAGDDGLAGRVEIGCLDDEAGFLRSLCAGLGYQRGIEHEHGGHASLAGGNGKLHGASAGFYGADRVCEAQGSGDYVGGPFAEGVAGGKGRVNAVLGEDAGGGYAHR